MFHAILHSGAEVAPIHTKVFNSLQEKPKLKKESVFLQTVTCDSIDVDGCASLKYETGREKQEQEFFVVPESNRNIILGRDQLKQLGVGMYYDLGWIRIGKSYVKMEEDIHISSLARVTTHTIIRPHTGKFCLCIPKGNE